MDKQKLESVQINKIVETCLYTAFPPKAMTPGGKAGCVLMSAPERRVHRLKDAPSNLPWHTERIPISAKCS